MNFKRRFVCNKGAIFENLVADIFTKMGKKLYYYRKESGLEIDFIIWYKSGCYLVKVKTNQGNSKSVKTILNNSNKYHVDGAIKLGNYNIGKYNNILTLPLYLTFLLNDV